MVIDTFEPTTSSSKLGTLKPTKTRNKTPKRKIFPLRLRRNFLNAIVNIYALFWISKSNIFAKRFMY